MELTALINQYFEENLIGKFNDHDSAFVMEIIRDFHNNYYKNSNISGGGLREKIRGIIAADWANHEDNYPYIENTVDECMEVIVKELETQLKNSKSMSMAYDGSEATYRDGVEYGLEQAINLLKENITKHITR